MAKPIVERTKKKTKVVYNKKPKKKNNDKNIIIGSVAGIVVLATSLGLGLGLGLKKSNETVDPTLFRENDGYPVKVVYEKYEGEDAQLAKENEQLLKEARQLLEDIYEPNVSYKTYIKYYSDWNDNFVGQLFDTEIIILANVKLGSNYNSAKNKYCDKKEDGICTVGKLLFDIRILAKDDKGEYNRDEIYNKIKKWKETKKSETG